MKSRKLTPKQREVFDLLNKTGGGLLRQHIKPTGLVCWRLLDAEARPILNVSESIVWNLVDKDVLQKDGQNYILKATIGNDNVIHAK